MSSSPSILDLTEKVNLRNWIGTGQKYKNVPEVVSLELQSRVSLSEASRNALLPSPQLSIIEFLQKTFPPLFTAFILDNPANFFTQQPPNRTLSYLIESPHAILPPLDFVNRLRDAAGQAMLDGHCSIRYSGGHSDVYLPFEACGLWAEIHRMLKAQDGWRKARKWVELHGSQLGEERVESLASCLRKLPWDGLIPKLGHSIHSSEMADLLSDSQLTSSHIDTMLCRLRARYRDEHIENGRTTVLIPLTSFTDNLRVVGAIPKDDAAAAKIQEIPDLVSLGQALRDVNHDVLIATVSFFPPGHWGFLTIKISQDRIIAACGDSLHRKFPPSLRKGLKRWSRHYLPHLVFSHSAGLSCGTQSDSFSCGITSINGLKHYLFLDRLWKDASKVPLRTDEFLSCVNFCLDTNTVDAPMVLSNLANNTIPSVSHGDTALPEPLPRPPNPPYTAPSTSNDAQSIPTKLLSPPRPAAKRRRASSKLIFKPIVYAPPSNAPDNSPTSPRRSPEKRARRATTPDGSSSSSRSQHKASPKQKTLIKQYVCGSPKKRSKSALAKAKINAQVTAGTWMKNSRKWESYLGRLRKIDSRVAVYEGDPRKARLARCSLCGKDIQQSEPYNTSRFKEHLERCPAKGKQARFQSIDSFFAAVESPQSQPTPPKSIDRPCTGLTAAHHPQINVYTSRTEVRYAGGKSIHGLSIRRFNKLFNELSDEEKAVVDREYENSCRWELKHDTRRVVSRSCRLNAPSRATDISGTACVECLRLLEIHEFKVALSRAGASDENRKFIPHRFQGMETGRMFATNRGLGKLVQTTHSEDGDFLISFSKALVRGDFDDNPSFIQLMHVMNDRNKRELHGKGLQNMQYGADIDRFNHELACVSPEASRIFQSKFGGRSHRSMLNVRSKQPQMTIGVSDSTLKRCQKYLKDYNYPSEAPLACAVDDSKLHAAARPLYHASSKKWFIYGSVQGPIEVSDEEQLDELMNLLHDRLATKLRLWTLSIPLPHVPPLILSIIPISESNTAVQLFEMEKKLLQLLLIDSPTRFNIISLGSDGTVVERDARRLLVHSKFAATEITYLKHPDPSEKPLEVTVLRIGNRRLAIIQDSKHLRKTCRNNLFSGARQLVLGEKLAFYEQMHTMVLGPSPDNLTKQESSLYIGDVINVDRQDDPASARAFSAEAMEEASARGPEYTGLVIYQFICGEACDAYQSRHIGHGDRIKMVLRASFFKSLWKCFLAENKYPLSRSYISREADDIIDILVNGLLALVIIHRDHLQTPFPLLPWAHGSETNEHVFGLLRSTVPDFTLVDALQAIPKIDIRLLAACRDKVDPSKLRRSRSGYVHTYFDAADFNIPLLSAFPSHDEFSAICDVAWTEANQLWEVLGYFRAGGVVPSSVEYPSSPEEGDDIDDSPLVSENPPPPETPISDRQELDDALRAASDLRLNPDGPLPDEATTILDECGMVAAAFNIRDLAAVEELPDSSPDEILQEMKFLLDTLLSQIATTSGHSAVQDLQLDATPSHVPTPPTPVITSSVSIPVQGYPPSSFDVTSLIRERRSHQSLETTQACRPIRLAPVLPISPGDCTNSSSVKEPSPRQLLAQKIYATIKLSGVNSKGQTAGLARQARHGTNTTNATAGNAANAKLASKSTAQKLVNSRKKSFTGIPHSIALTTGNVTEFEPLCDGRFGIVYHEDQLMIGKVITFYQRGGGKTARHAWTARESSIGEVSWISMQLWLATSSPKIFRSSTPSGIIKYGYVHSKSFLYAIAPAHIAYSEGNVLCLTDTFTESVFNKLRGARGLIEESVKKLLSTKHTSAADEDGGS